MITLTTLSNGFRVVSERMPGLESASLGVWVGAGSRHEGETETGIAHFLEHMAFKGTSRRSARQIAEAIEDVGGYLNAYTSRETTAYYARVLAADVPLALDVIADILLDPAFDPAEIETERHVILQEIGQTLDTPDDVIFDWLQETAYPDQPMGRSILGPAERVRAFREADFRAFTGRHYCPGRMILAAAGAVDHAALVRAAEAAFGHLPAVATPAEAPARFVPGLRTEEGDLEQVHLALAFEGPAWHSDEVHAAQIYATAMGGGMSSRLFQTIREQHGLCYSIFAQAASHADTGQILVYAGTGADDLDALTRLAASELSRAADDLGQPELDRARAQIRAGLLMGLESPSQRTERMARMLAIWGRVPDPAETLARFDAVDLAALRGFAAQICARLPAIAVYGPAGSVAPAGALAARFAG
jgi:predicted Zn-dependent peptidase